MKAEIHPAYVAATITCGCGNSWETRSTKEAMRIEICSACHPFYTGEQRIVDTAGRVERFRRRFGITEESAGEATGESDAAAAESAAAK